MRNKTVTKLELDELKKIGKLTNKNISKLEEGYPIQYLIGYVNFYGNKIFVDKNVLIPRYETEYLVEKTIKLIKELEIDNPKVLDACCGSGCIGLTIKKELPTSKVTLSDISAKALKIAKKNKNNLNLKVDIIKSDLLKKIKETDFDVIISNPPYVMYTEELPKEVSYEPSIALFSDEEGTYHIKEILKEAKKHLKEKYLIAFEINEKSEEQLTKIVKKYFLDSTFSFQKDLQGKTRYLFIYKNNE